MLTSRNLLLVEDSRALQHLICTQLEREFEIQPLVCNTYRELQLLLEDAQSGKGDFQIKMAISDLYLSDAPPGAAAHLLRKNNIPTILATGRKSSNIKNDLGFDHLGDCLVKDSPNFIHLLSRTLRHVDQLAGRKALVISKNSNVLNSLRPALRTRLMDVYETGFLNPKLGEILSQNHFDVVLLELAPIELAPGDQLRSNAAIIDVIRNHSQNEGAPIFGIINRSDSHEMPLHLTCDLDDFIKLPVFSQELQWRLYKRIFEADQTKQLRETAIRDYLTGLYNRRYFFEEAEKRTSLAKQTGRDLQVAMIDIDYFKKLNDTYGHEIGDIVLEAVAQRFEKLCGNTHLLARLGGEEFAVLMDLDTTLKAEAFCEEIRLAICSSPIVTTDGPLNVSVSIGIAGVCGNEEFINYITAADQYLYMAKHTGRNRVLAEERFEETG